MKKVFILKGMYGFIDYKKLTVDWVLRNPQRYLYTPIKSRVLLEKSTPNYLYLEKADGGVKTVDYEFFVKHLSEDKGCFYLHEVTRKPKKTILSEEIKLKLQELKHRKKFIEES